MTPQQAAAILGFLAEGFRAEVSSVEAAIWTSELCALDAGLAEAAARRVVRESEFFPPLARFHGTYNAERRARAAHQPALPEQPTDRVTPARFRAGLETARASLRRSSP